MTNCKELILKKIDSDIFTDTDLCTILEGSKNSRYGLIKRMIAKGDIVHIRRGLYCLADKYKRHEINLYEVALRIYGPSYVSLESALSYHGWIPEAVYTTTSACMKRAKDFDTPLGLFSFKHIPSFSFYHQVDRVEPSRNTVFFMARPLKALADYVYVYKKDWKDLGPAIESLRIEFDSFKSVDLNELDDLQKQYRSRRVQKFIKGAKKELARL